jgi:hypothetical protein
VHRSILILGTVVLAVAGCASEPAKVKPAPVAQAPVAQNKGITLAEARKLGYQIVNENGKTVYCQDSRPTGSHARKETICLTEDEVIAAREASRRNLEQMQRITPPPACGKGSKIAC